MSHQESRRTASSRHPCERCSYHLGAGVGAADYGSSLGLLRQGGGKDNRSFYPSPLKTNDGLSVAEKQSFSVSDHHIAKKEPLARHDGTLPAEQATPFDRRSEVDFVSSTSSPSSHLPHVNRGAAAVLKRMTLDEWDQLVDGEISAADLRAKYLGDDGRDQVELEEWSR